jgi:hypothetical protein
VAVVTWPRHSQSSFADRAAPSDVGTSTSSVGFFGGTYGTSLPMSCNTLGPTSARSSFVQLVPWLAIRPFQGALVMHQPIPAPSVDHPYEHRWQRAIVRPHPRRPNRSDRRHRGMDDHNTSQMDHPFHLHVWPMQLLTVGSTVIDTLTWQNVVNVPARTAAPFASPSTPTPAAPLTTATSSTTRTTA